MNTKNTRCLQIKLFLLTLCLPMLVSLSVNAAPAPALRMNQSSYSVGEFATYVVTGAQPNSKILWSSWKDGVSTGEENADYGHRTDANGNWSATAGSWDIAHVGLWKKQATVAGRHLITSFRVGPRALNSFTQKVGVYGWGKQGTLEADTNRLVSIGGRNIRLLFPTTCPGTALTQRAQNEPEIRRAFNNPSISTYVFSAYDEATNQNCDPNRKFYLDPSIYSAQKIAEIEKEYEDFTLYLYRTYQTSGKRFIISHWEGDNAIYCSSAYGYATDATFRQQCRNNYSTYYRGIPNPEEGMRGMQLWLTARQNGINRGRAQAESEGISGVEVFHAPEFNIVRALRENGLKSMLYDVLPNIEFDFVSYSAYESTNVFPNRVAEDLNTVASVVNSRQIIIGEFGYDRFTFKDDDIEARTSAVLDSALDWGVSYIFAWVLHDEDQIGQAHFGLFDGKGQIQPIGRYYQSRFTAR